MRDLVHLALTVALALGWAREVRLRRLAEAALAEQLDADVLRVRRNGQPTHQGRVVVQAVP